MSELQSLPVESWNETKQTTHIVPEETRVSTNSEKLLLLISLVTVGLNPESLTDGHDEGSSDESEVVVVEEGEGLGSGVDDSTSGESEGKKEGGEGYRDESEISSKSNEGQEKKDRREERGNGPLIL